MYGENKLTNETMSHINDQSKPIPNVVHIFDESELTDFVDVRLVLVQPRQAEKVVGLFLIV